MEDGTEAKIPRRRAQTRFREPLRGINPVLIIMAESGTGLKRRPLIFLRVWIIF
ncbi:hypothetical protein ZQ34_004835 [Salmonella enterica subsp. salamae]|nr:hypothetical protein [Salmonella enterica subsp. salamae]